jgi:hypothetical protein
VAVRVNDREVSEEKSAFFGARVNRRYAHNTVDASSVERNEIIAFLFPTFPRITD